MTTTFCWDTTLLLHAERADRLDTLHTYLPDVRHVVCDVVLRELGTPRLPSWLEEVPTHDLDVLTAFVRWQAVVGTAGPKNAGEAAVLAWAETHGAVAIIDDRDAKRAAHGAGVQVHGSAWALAQGVKAGAATDRVTTAFCDALLDTGIRWPFGIGGFATWAKAENLRAGDSG